MPTHTEALYARYDGAIPPKMLRLAKARDAAERAARHKPHARIGAIRWKPHTIVARMADAMRREAGAFGACTRGDLLAAGFTPREIERYREEAAAEAARLNARRVVDAGDIASPHEAGAPRARKRHGETVPARTYVNGAGAAGALPASGARRTE